MSPKLKKLSVLIIAAVLLGAVAFVGAASASEVPADNCIEVSIWNDLSTGFTDPSVDEIILIGDIIMEDQIIVNNDKILDLNGHKLTAASNTRLFNVSNDVSFTLKDSSSGGTGKLIGNGQVNGYGGGVRIESGTFIMESGNITGCSVGNNYRGGGVYVMNGGTFIMESGNITGCSAQNGGGVSISYGGTFTMTGGTIAGCTATNNGGGVQVQYGGTFTMKGGTIITGCSATNYGGGVCVSNDGTFKVNGTATISGNTNGSVANNVLLLCNDGLQLLAGGFTGKIGINSVNGKSPVSGAQFGIAEEEATGAENFISDDGKFAGYIDVNDGNKLKWGITAAGWNALTDAQVTALSGTVYIVDPDETAVIYPKFNSTTFAIANDLTLDFTGYKGKFAGEPSASGDNKGALFGKIDNSSYTGTLTIKNLTMKDVKVASDGNYIGGIVGLFKGKPASNLNFSNCRLENCSIAGNKYVGGLVGCVFYPSVNVDDCKVTNSTVASTDSFAGGLVSSASSASFDSCCVENVSVYAGSYCVGGLVGYAGSLNEMRSCNVENCVIASSSDTVGGLVGSALGASARGITNCVVQNTAVNGTTDVGGLVGYANSVTDCSNNAVNYSAVKGTAASVYFDCGNKPGQVGCTATDSYLNNGTAGQPLIIVYPHTVTPQTVPTQFGFITVVNLTGIGLTTDQKTAAAYVVYETTPVVFDPCNESATYAGTISLGDTAITKPVRAGYSFNSWNLSSSAGTMLTDKDGTLQANVAGYTNASHQWNNASGVTVNLFANWTVNKTKVTSTGTYAKFGNDNVTAINQSQTKVVTVVLENVTQVSPGNDVTFIADNSSLTLPELNGYTRNDEICVFEIDATIDKVADYSSIVLNITFDTATTASENKDKVVFLHYNTTRNTWDTTPLAHSLSQSGNKVEYLVHTTSFSPFGIGIYTKNSNPTPSYSSSSSRQTGYTQILLEGQDVPTVTPTLTPTVAPTPVVNPTANPTTQPTQSSPAPVAGIIAGLGAAALVLTRLRK